MTILVRKEEVEVQQVFVDRSYSLEVEIWIRETRIDAYSDDRFDDFLLNGFGYNYCVFLVIKFVELSPILQN